MAFVPKQKLVSPIGTFRYPHLTKPDFGTDAFPKVNGEYNVQLLLDKADADKLMAILKPHYDSAIAAGREAFSKLKVEQRKKLKEVTLNDLMFTEYDRDTEEPTGRYFFKFSTAASGKSKKDGKPWSKKLAVVDSLGNPLPAGTDVWGGSEGRISFTFGEYFVAGTGTAGLKLYLEAVQIKKLHSGGGGTNDFDAIEGGFVADDEETTAAPEAADESIDDVDF